MENIQGTINTNVRSSYLALNVNGNLEFGPNWRPYLSAGLGINWQKIKNSNLQFNDFSFQNNNLSNSDQLTFQLGAGISYSLAEEHNIGVAFETFIYDSPYASDLLIADPTLSLFYNFYIPLKSEKSNELLSSYDTGPTAGIQFCSQEQRNEIDTLLKELSELEEEIEKVRKEIEKNGLNEEVEALRALVEALKALDQMEEAGTEALGALEEFTKCNNEELIKQFKKSESARNGVITSLKFLSTFLKIYSENNKKNQKLLKKVTDKIDENIKRAEKALKQGEIEKALNIILAIKTEITWPIDVLEIILKDLWKQLEEAYDEAGKTAAKKALEAALKKVFGASAGAAGSIAQDAINLADLLWRLYGYDELNEQRNEKLIELIKALKDAKLSMGSGRQSTCLRWESAKSIKSIIFSVELVCWCPDEEGSLREGKWVVTELDMEPHDKGNKKTLTLKKPKMKGTKDIKIQVPEKQDLPCDAIYCYFRVVGHITHNDGTTGTLTGRGEALE